MDKPNPGLTALFVDAFRQQTEAQKEVTSEKTEERDPEVVAWENDEITSIQVKTVEVKPPVVPLPEEAAQAPKAHRLTAEEKEIKAAVMDMDTLKGQIDVYKRQALVAEQRKEVLKLEQRIAELSADRTMHSRRNPKQLRACLLYTSWAEQPAGTM